jgi:hypothetical protein
MGGVFEEVLPVEDIIVEFCSDEVIEFVLDEAVFEVAVSEEVIDEFSEETLGGKSDDVSSEEVELI